MRTRLGKGARAVIDLGTLAVKPTLGESWLPKTSPPSSSTTPSTTTTSCWWISGRRGAVRAAPSRPTFTKASDKHPDVVFAKVDTEAEQALAAAAEIRSIPTLMAFKKGKLVFNQAGALPPAALEQLIQQVKDFDIDAAIATQQREEV